MNVPVMKFSVVRSDVRIFRVPGLIALLFASLFFVQATAQTPSRVIRAIDERCALCHVSVEQGQVSPVEGAPSREIMGQMAAETILQAITIGTMRVHTEDIDDDGKRAMAEFISGRKLGPLEAGEASNMPNRCTSSLSISNPADSQGWNGWGPDVTNARFQRAPGFSAADVPDLELKWAFGFPGVSSVYGQPTIVGDTVFVGVDTGYVYALDTTTGCVHWSYLAESGVRNSVSIGAYGDSGTSYAAYFGDIRANVYAVDVETGEMLWKTKVDPHPLAVVTGAPTLYDDRLYVPVSSREEAAGGSLQYECCTFRGSVAALDSATGRQIWKTYPIPDEPTPIHRNSRGVQLWTGAGAAIWHAPTIDPESRAVYVATGDGYTEPAHINTDAVMAFDMDSGAVLWAVQDWENDAWLVACGENPTENCPEPLGPDFDFGTSPILHSLPDGGRVLLAGQKSGFVFAHDPDQDGARLWRTELVEPAGAAEILFGGAADEDTAYFALDNGTVAALDPATGEPRWLFAPTAETPGGVTAALTAVPGALFVGWRGGTITAHDSEDGQVIWHFDMMQDFTTVNDVPASGGSLGAPGPTVAGGMVFVGSGYVGLGNGNPGNVLLAFGPR
ncbi:MAG: PQQ-binding-like beta-propeller repeat protein [Candidatus Rariloculaceae bacterium]